MCVVCHVSCVLCPCPLGGCLLLAARFGRRLWPLLLSFAFCSVEYSVVIVSRCSLRLRLCSLLTLEVAAKSGALHALTDENKMKGTFEVHILVVGSLRA